MKVCYPKFKLGEEVVRLAYVPPTYGKFMSNEVLHACMCMLLYYYNILLYTITCIGCVHDTRKLLFSEPKCDMTETRSKYEGKTPDPLNSQFPNKRGREKTTNTRRQKTTAIFRPG